MRCFFLLMLSLFLMSIALQKADFQKVISIEDYDLMIRELAASNNDHTTASSTIDTNRNAQARKYVEVSNDVQIQQKVYNFFSEVNGQYSWFVLVSEECRYWGYTLPIFQALATAANEIDLSIAPWSDNQAQRPFFSNHENDWFPTLVCVNKNSNKVLFSWPAPATLLDANLRESYLSLTEEKLKIASLDDWFEKDHGQSIQLEIYELFKKNIH